jgi:hypothetical protein
VPVVLATTIALFAAAPATATESNGRTSCPGIAHARGNSVEIDRFYARRATLIVRAALSQDLPTLDAQVDRRAHFALWRGDFSSSGRDEGSAGAIEFARDLRPVRFELASVQPGPISVLVPDCRWSVTILFRTPQTEVGVSVRFDFREGRLTSATGSQVAILEGEIR